MGVAPCGGFREIGCGDRRLRASSLKKRKLCKMQLQKKIPDLLKFPDDRCGTDSWGLEKPPGKKCPCVSSLCREGRAHRRAAAGPRESSRPPGSPCTNSPQGAQGHPGPPKSPVNTWAPSPTGRVADQSWGTFQPLTSVPATTHKVPSNLRNSCRNGHSGGFQSPTCQGPGSQPCPQI